ncbi:unnamed protein product [Leptidea sinapis]|uniref:Uncharacterized protein n=1 Tax=Leptidea sinapis TaxID=189913 RepID=A0A5E4QA29_9NEOP|nr:unnamed protein product [Leptidea sinapis]
MHPRDTILLGEESLIYETDHADVEEQAGLSANSVPVRAAAASCAGRLCGCVSEADCQALSERVIALARSTPNKNARAAAAAAVGAVQRARGAASSAAALAALAALAQDSSSIELQRDLSSPDLCVRRASLCFLRQLTQKAAKEVCTYALQAKDHVPHKSYCGVAISETGLPGALFAYLDLERDATAASYARDTLTCCLLAAANTTVFAMECIQKIMSACEATCEPAHFDLVKAKEKLQKDPNADYLSLHLSELVRMAFVGATGESDALRLSGLRTLQTIIQMVHQLLVSSLDKLNKKGNTTLIYNESMATLEKFNDSAPGSYVKQLDTKPINNKAELARWKQQVSQSNNDVETDSDDYGDFESKGESLLKLVNPELVSLSENWLAALRDHALLSLPPEVVHTLGEGGPTGDLAPGKSLVFACLEVCVCLLVRRLPSLSPLKQEGRVGVIGVRKGLGVHGDTLVVKSLMNPIVMGACAYSDIVQIKKNLVAYKSHLPNNYCRGASKFFTTVINY